MTHDRERWAALRRFVATGDIGGVNDGADVVARETRTIEASLACDHAAWTSRPTIHDYWDLLIALEILAKAHERKHGTRCPSMTNEAIAERALAIWRDAYGADPIIPVL